MAPGGVSSDVPEFVSSDPRPAPGWIHLVPKPRSGESPPPLPNPEPSTGAASSTADEEAFADFYVAAYRRIVGQVVAVTGDRAEAEDISQEAFLQASRRWAVICTYDAPEAWVRRIALNMAISGRRRAARKARAMLRVATTSATTTAPADHGVDALALAQALHSLPWRYRAVLALHYLADLSVADVALELGVPEATVKTRLARGRRRLGQLLAERPSRECP